MDAHNYIHVDMKLNIYTRDATKVDFYTLKKIGFLRNPQKRFRRLENVSKCVKMLKKRIFNSKGRTFKGSSPVYPREEPLKVR